MGVVWTDQTFGNESDLEKVEMTYAADEMNIEYGLEDRRYLRNTTVTISTESSVCAAGIEQDAGSLGNSGDITSVDATLTEMTTDPGNAMEARNPGADIETGVRLLKLGDCILYVSTEKKYSVAGQGNPPIPNSALGALLSTYVTKAFAPAHGTFDIAVDSTATISNIRTNKPKDNVWDWSVEAGCLVANPAPSTSNILSPPAEVTVFIPANHKGVYEQSLRLAKRKNSRPTQSWTLTLYPQD